MRTENGTRRRKKADLPVTIGEFVVSLMSMLLPFSPIEWLIVVFCAMVIGFSKTGMVGGGILFAPFLACIMPARESTGFALPMMAFADILAIIYWRSHVKWLLLLRLMPWTVVGLMLGYVCLDRITDELHMPIIGGIILGLITITIWRNLRPNSEASIPTYWWFGAGIGILLGTVSMLANTGMAVLTIYLLAMRLDKREFVGTGAWFFWIVNLVKIPMSRSLDLIDQTSLLTNLLLAPGILLGGYLGIMLVHRIPQKAFITIVAILAAVSAFYLVVQYFV